MIGRFFSFLKAAQIWSTRPMRYSPIQADQKKPNWAATRPQSANTAHTSEARTHTHIWSAHTHTKSAHTHTHLKRTHTRRARTHTHTHLKRAHTHLKHTHTHIWSTHTSEARTHTKSAQTDSRVNWALLRFFEHGWINRQNYIEMHVLANIRVNSRLRKACLNVNSGEKGMCISILNLCFHS